MSTRQLLLLERFSETLVSTNDLIYFNSRVLLVLKDFLKAIGATPSFILMNGSCLCLLVR